MGGKDNNNVTLGEVSRAMQVFKDENKQSHEAIQMELRNIRCILQGEGEGEGLVSKVARHDEKLGSINATIMWLATIAGSIVSLVAAVGLHFLGLTK